jgi:hypothetical protein
MAIAGKQRGLLVLPAISASAVADGRGRWAVGAGVYQIEVAISAGVSVWRVGLWVFVGSRLCRREAGVSPRRPRAGFEVSSGFSLA